MNDANPVQLLLVDDDVEMRLLIRRVAEAARMNVTEAVDGAEAIFFAMSNQYDLITMDINMPNVDGIDAIRAIRTVDPEANIVVISSRDDVETRAQVAALGVESFLPKPFEISALASFLSRNTRHTV